MKEKAKYYAAKMGVLQNFEILLGASTDFDGVFRDSIRLGS